jgi:xanthine dehydrogenase accessory factor
MLELASTLCAWTERGDQVAVATLVSSDGSAPRTVGAAMAVNSAGDVAGSISGGCVESELYEACCAVLAGGPARVLEFGIGDEVFEPGLTCGGTITVLVSAFAALDDSALHQVRRAAAGQAASLSLSASGASCTDEPLITLRSDPGPELLVVGAVEFAVALCSLGTAAGFRVTVCDPRPVFTTKERFPDAYAVVCDWPDRWLASRTWMPTDAVCVLSHDPKVDLPVLAAALASPAGFVGAMGSRRTHDRRVSSLRSLGVSASALSRLRSPIGLDIGASTPEHTAIAILAEVIGVTNGASGAALTGLEGPIHR